MWRVTLHVLEVEEVLAPLGHCLQVWEELQQLCELVLEGRKNIRKLDEAMERLLVVFS